MYDIPDSDVSELLAVVDAGKYNKYWPEQKTIRCFGYFKSSDLDTILEEIQDVAQKLNTYYGIVPTGIETS